MWLISRASAQLFWRAGPSTRMGRPKQLLQFCGQTMVRRAASVVVKARMPPCGRRDGRTRGGHERSFERTRRARSGEPAMAIRNKLFHPRRLRHCRKQGKCLAKLGKVWRVCQFRHPGNSIPECKFPISDCK
ncbi:MAG: hypothetical protein DME64_00550 [Verrucomicrobia bacterium]|nr:MAG: hypothetical protein DME64_00550 [Verrucomicrobiota bacterium]